jgi:hypothetical protein
LDRDEQRAVGAACDYWTGWLRGVRPRVIPDRTLQGQQEHEADLDGSPGETDQWRALLHLLAADTADPDDCYFGLWEGWGLPESARSWPTFAVPRDAQIPARSYFLFHGSLSEAEIWGLHPGAPEHTPRRDADTTRTISPTATDCLPARSATAAQPHPPWITAARLCGVG